MNLDYVLVAVVLFFAAWGAVSGAARQIAQIAGGVVALLMARPLGQALGPHAARLFETRLTVGLVAATLVAFAALFLLTRAATTAVLRRLFAGGDPRSRTLDRLLGFAFAALKVTLLIYVVLCGLTFVEENVAVAGKRLGLSPRSSFAFNLARRYNLFELARFGAAHDLAAVARAASDPKQADRLKADPKFKAVQKDDRFRRLLQDAAVRRAFEEGDDGEVLTSPAVQELLKDPGFTARLREAAAALR